jgi:two-component system sensor histidine kinase BaeS
MRRFIPRGIAARVALACMLVLLLAVAIIGTGVLEVARMQFEQLMMKHGSTSSEANAMFQQTVSGIFAVAVLVAAALSVVVAILLARHIARPLEEVSRAANRLARGDYRARVVEKGPDEIRSLAVTFNAMAESLQDQEKVRRDFVAGAAHELLTPLTNLQGYLEALRDGVLAPSRPVFASLHEEAERLVRLSQALLDLAEGPSRTAASETLDLRKVVESTVQLVAPAMDRRHIGVTIDLPPSIAVRSNPDHLTQVLFNLLQNAGRYASEGEAVSVRAQSLGRDVRVSVSNSGSTITPEELPRIFDRFYRVDRSRDRSSGGYGLGLALVKQLIEAAGGQVGAESAGGSTTVWFTLAAA